MKVRYSKTALHRFPTIGGDAVLAAGGSARFGVSESSPCNRS
jgi:hypothetical protein